MAMGTLRRASRLSAVTLAAVIALLCVATIDPRAPATAQSDPYLRSSATALGMTLTLMLPRRAYRWNALIPVRVRLDNHSSHPWGLVKEPDRCDRYNFSLYPVTHSGRVLEAVPLRFLSYFCNKGVAGYSLLPGHSLWRQEYALVRAGRLEASLGGERALLTTPPITLHLVSGGAPATIAVSPSPVVQADVRSPGSSATPILYQYVLHCESNGDRSGLEEAYWTVAPAGHIVAPVYQEQPSTCSWSIVAGRAGYPVRKVIYREVPPSPNPTHPA